jgi:hypothetical protein
MKNRRVDWLKADVKRLFPYASNLVEAKTKNYASLYLSRVPFPDGIFDWMSDEQRVEKLAEDGVRAAIVKMPEERLIIGTLASAAHGLTAFGTDSTE